MIQRRNQLQNEILSNNLHIPNMLGNFSMMYDNTNIQHSSNPHNDDFVMNVNQTKIINEDKSKKSQKTPQTNNDSLQHVNSQSNNIFSNINNVMNFNSVINPSSNINNLNDNIHTNINHVNSNVGIGSLNQPTKKEDKKTSNTNVLGGNKKR